jgi:helix-turn-helix protein
MDKNELIACIRDINKSATAEFLSGFSQEELTEYLERLMEQDLADVTVTN